MKSHKVTVILYPGEAGAYVSYIPLFPECTTQGSSVEEALANARESLELHLEDAGDDDLENIELSHVPHVVVGQVDVAAPERLYESDRAVAVVGAGQVEEGT